MSSPVSYVSGEEKKESDCTAIEHEKENEDNLMKEYYGNYGQANGHSAPSSEAKQLS